MLIIAEAGSNHEGSLDKAKELVDWAVIARADIVKFQAINRARIWKNPDSRPEWVEQSKEFFEEVHRYCTIKGIEFLCTPFDIRFIPWLNPLVKRWKLASRNLHDWAIRSHMERTGKPVIASFGYATPEDAKEDRRVVPLVCRPEYPARPESYALRAWASALKKREWGISDHTIGYGTAIAAVGLGASIVEKHFRLPGSTGPDAGKHALLPAELGEFVALVRDAALARDGLFTLPERPGDQYIWV